MDDWLVEEANVRGFLGAVGAAIPDRAASPGVTDIDLVVALLMPHAAADGRVFKLIVRLLQKVEVDARRVWLCARREQADRALYWLLQQVPGSERVGGVASLLEAAPVAPRGYRPLKFNYDGRRLLRRPATKESLWKAARR